MGSEWGLVGEEGAIHTGGYNEETVLGENDMVVWSGSCETLLPALACLEWQCTSINLTFLP